MPKILVIAVAGFLLLAGAVVSGLQHFELGPFAPEEEDAATPGGNKKASTRKGGDPPRFLAMDRLVIPIIQGDRITAKLQMEIKLETDRKREPKLKKLLPKLKDALFRDLHGYFPRAMAHKDGVDLAMLKERLMIIGERAIGKGLMDAILIQEYLVDKPGSPPAGGNKPAGP